VVVLVVHVVDMLMVVRQLSVGMLMLMALG
jgi:hypothetical protein